MYRAYLASNRGRIVLDEISSSDSSDLLAIRLLAEYLGDRNKFNDLIKRIENRLSQPSDSDTVIWTIVCAVLFINEGMFEDALRLLNDVDDLECMAMQVYVLLQMNRVDLAMKSHQKMQEKDDDATLTQLAQAWINIELGGEKMQDAHYIFDDLIDKFSSSVTLSNNMAVCAMGQQKFEDGVHEQLRLGLDRDANNPALLVNFIFYASQTEKNADSVMNRYLTILKETNKNFDLLKDLEKKEIEFDRLCANYAVPDNQEEAE